MCSEYEAEKYGILSLVTNFDKASVSPAPQPK